MFGLQMNLGMGSFRSKLKALFAHLFTNRTTTIDGTRYLVNEGEGDNAVMHTGQGAYFNGVDQYATTNFVPDKYKEYTIFANVDLTTPTNGKSKGILGSVGVAYNQRFYIATLHSNHTSLLPSGHTTAFYFGDSGSVVAFDTANYQDKRSNIAITISSTTLSKIVKVSIDGILVLTKSIAVPDTTPYFKVVIGNVNEWDTGVNQAAYYSGAIKDIYLIPKALTGQEIQAHYNNPEQTLYWDNGVLKSDILDQATIDSMQAGNGFWYPFTENVLAGGYYRNHALPYGGDGVIDSTYKPLVNWTTTTSTNAQQLTSGYQCALQELDSFGLPIAKPYGILHGDGRGYIDLQDQVIEGDFELDVYINTLLTETGGSLLYNISGFSAANEGGASLVFRFLNSSRKRYINRELLQNAVVTAGRSGTNGFLYRNGVKIVDDFTDISTDVLYMNEMNRIRQGESTSLLQITKGTRTDEQRTADVTKLMTKYGVV